MEQIFISYRHDDSIYVCDRIYAALEHYFGKERVFFAKPSIQPGTRFPKRLQDASNSCDVMLAVMGKRWMTISDEYGRRKIDDPQDWVIQELQNALERNIAVIPILLENMSMPPSSALPSALSDLVELQCQSLRPGDDFDRDMEALIATIELYVKKKAQEPVPLALEEAVDIHESKQMVKIPPFLPNILVGTRLTTEENDTLLTNIKRLLQTHRVFGKAYVFDLIKRIDIPDLDLRDFQVVLTQAKDNNKEIVVLSLNDERIRLPMDTQPWKLNLQRFSRQRDGFIELYHNGDNSLETPFREGSYGRNAPYSVTRFAVQQFPELQSTDPDLVYLGTLPQKDVEQFAKYFVDVHRRLTLYRFARWLWLWNHPRRLS